MPGGTAVAVAALVLTAWLLSHNTAAEAGAAAIAVLFGLALYFVVRFTVKSTSRPPAID